MSAIITLTDKNLSMNSQEIADLVEKRHDNVKRTIETLANQEVIEFPQIEEIPTATRPSTVYVFSGERGKRDSIIVVAQLSPEFTARLVDRWQELEAGAKSPSPTALSRMQILEIAMESEKARIEAEAQRDEAVRIKALIGSKREATAMATAAKAVREVKRLTEELGRNARHATVIAVEKATGRKFGPQDWRPLREFCKTKGLPTEKVMDPRWGEVKAWPAEAWRAVHGIDLRSLFPEQPAGLH